MDRYPTVKLEIFVPEEYVERITAALSALGAGRLGRYENCFSLTRVRGFWRPLPGANPAIGEVGRLEMQEECKIEMNCPAELVREAVRQVRALHPYEEPLIQVVPLLNQDDLE